MIYATKMIRECLIINFSSNTLLRVNEEEYKFVTKFASFINEENSISIFETLELTIKSIERYYPRWQTFWYSTHDIIINNSRHTFATHMLNNGADINAIKDLLGHSNLNATQVYTHNTVEKLKSIYKQAHPRA